MEDVVRYTKFYESFLLTKTINYALIVLSVTGIFYQLKFLFFRISLNTMTLIVDSPTVYTSQGVPISVTGIAQVLTII